MSKLQQELKQTRPFASLPVEVFLNLIRTTELLRAQVDIVAHLDAAVLYAASAPVLDYASG